MACARLIACRSTPCQIPHANLFARTFHLNHASFRIQLISCGLSMQLRLFYRNRLVRTDRNLSVLRSLSRDRLENPARPLSREVTLRKTILGLWHNADYLFVPDNSSVARDRVDLALGSTYARCVSLWTHRIKGVRGVPEARIDAHHPLAFSTPSLARVNPSFL